MKIVIKKYFILYLFLIAILLKDFSAQSLSGMSGYLSIPSANNIGSGRVDLGVSYISKETLEYGQMSHDIVSPYLQLGFLPFMEVGLRLIRQLNYEGVSHNVDRSLSLKVQFLYESHYQPAIALGIQSIPSGTEDATHFQSVYVVASKNFYEVLGMESIGITIGYGNDLIDAADHQFIGFFGGFLISPWKWLEVISEYDAKYVNIGTKLRLFNNLKIMFAMLDMSYTSASISYGFQL